MRRILSLMVLGLLFLPGCKKVKTVLDLSPGFGLEVPAGFTVDTALNPNNEQGTTWLREDGRAMFSIDFQPMEGSRRSALLDHGKRTYLGQVGRELEHDLSSHLVEFHDFDSRLLEVAGQPALEISFQTRQEGQVYDIHLLLLVADSQPPHEIMLDYRLPHEDSETDQAWDKVLDTFAWISDEGGGEHGGEKAEGKDQGKEQAKEEKAPAHAKKSH
ncbi:MAG: hypothetical protein KC910_15210 [Candidatus Eremiobacteraeota bacterium]|nr:hypothetical protein [Candidatus Eremiobacteraeota bacterium]